VVVLNCFFFGREGDWFGDEMVLTMVGLVVMAERELGKVTGEVGNGGFCVVLQ